MFRLITKALAKKKDISVYIDPPKLLKVISGGDIKIQERFAMLSYGVSKEVAEVLVDNDELWTYDLVKVMY